MIQRLFWIARFAVTAAGLIALAVWPWRPLRGQTLATLDPRLKPVAPGVAHVLTSSLSVLVGAKFLDRPLVQYTSVIATTFPEQDLGVVDLPTEWVLHRSGNDLLVTQNPPPFSPPSAQPKVVGRCPVNEDPAGVRVTFIPSRHPLAAEVGSGALPGTGWFVQSVTTNMFQITDSAISYTETYGLSKGVSGPAPVEATVAFRCFLLARDPVLAPRPYTAADRTKAGLFSLAETYFLPPDTPGNVVLRHDLSRPIKFVLHPSVPEVYRSVISRGILSWNDALAAAAGKKPIQVEVGTDPTLFPGTPECVVVYWIGMSSNRMYQGWTPVFAHPRSGEILGGAVLLSEQQLFGVLPQQFYNDSLRHSVSAAAGHPMPHSVDPLFQASGAISEHRRPSQFGVDAQFDAALKERILLGTVVHECGHLLGLRHNFQGSADVEHIPAGEHSTTAMDYLGNDVPALRPLPYDVYALAYAQGLPVPNGSQGPFLVGMDETLATNPLSNSYDIGHPLAWALRGVKGLRRVTLKSDLGPEREWLFTTARSHYGILGKYLLLDGGYGQKEALACFEARLRDQGKDPLSGGGVDGKPSTDVHLLDADTRAAKFEDERAAAASTIAALAGNAKIPPAVARRLAAVLAKVVEDPARTDLYVIRYDALVALIKLGPAGTEALTAVQAALRNYTTSHPGAATAQQDQALAEKISKALAAQ